MGKHTEGPWINQGEDSEGGIPFIQIETDFRGEKTMFIARVEGNHETVGFKYELSDEDRANADLIAAAPDLLQSLEEIIKCLDEDGSFDKFPDPTSISGRARAAVAKARGQS